MTRAPNAGSVLTQHLPLPHIPKGLLEGSGIGLACSQGRTRLDSSCTSRWFYSDIFSQRQLALHPAEGGADPGFPSRAPLDFPLQSGAFFLTQPTASKEAGKGFIVLGRFWASETFTLMSFHLFSEGSSHHTLPHYHVQEATQAQIWVRAQWGHLIFPALCVDAFFKMIPRPSKSSEEISLIRFWFLMWLLQCYTWAYAVPVWANGLRAFCPP